MYQIFGVNMEIKIYATDKSINIDEVPELVIIKNHITEYYPDEKIYIFPYRSDNGRVYANFYIDLRCVASTALTGSAWVHKIRRKKELENKLTLVGINVR